MNSKLQFLLAGAASLLAASGCSVGPHYSANPPAQPAAFAGAAGPEKTGETRIAPGIEAVDRWWYTFRDPELESLVQRAVAGNRNLKIALSRIRQARVQAASVRGSLWPEIDATGGYNRGRGSNNVMLPFGSGAPASSSAPAAEKVSAENGPGTAPAAPAGPSAGKPAGPESPLGEGGFPGVTTNLFQAGFDATWEIDIFGGHRRTIEAADAETQAAEESGRAVMVSLLGEVAQTYLQVRASQRRLELAREELGIAHDTLAIIQAKARAGLATDLEVARQEAETATIAASVPSLQAAERTGTHRLAFLLGAAPDALDAELRASRELPSLPAEVPVGLPSDLLRRRPDIRRAERELAAATARIGIAKADLFPHFDLAAATGLDSSRLADLPKWSSRYYSLTPGVRWPLLDWGRARSGVRLSEEERTEAALQFDAAVAQALLEVEDALVRFRSGQAVRASQGDAVAASRQAFTIARQKYDRGLVDSLVVLDAHRALVASENALVENDAAVRLDLVALYKALGGGWEG